MRPAEVLKEGGLIRLSEKHLAIAASLVSDNTTETLLNTEPASASQRRTWFMELVAPGIPQHHLPFALEVFGEVDIAALQLGLDFLVERHEALRTVFVEDGGTLRQVIGAPRPTVMLVDAPSGPTPDLKTILHKQVAAPFDLSQGPLVRLVVVKRAPRVHVLVFVLHHIIADNLSLGLFVREMAEAYTSFCARNPPALAPLPWQYADFAIAEARWLATHTFRVRLQRYAEKLGPTMAQLDFGAGRAVRSGQIGANDLLPVDAATLGRLKEVAQRTGVTLFAVLLAALQTALAPYADGPDFVIAVPVAGRGSDGAEGIIGPFANVIALKASTRAAQTVAELVVDVGRQLVDTLEYENVPWDALVRATNPSRSADAAPLSQVMFSSVAVPIPFQRFGRLPCRPTWLPSPAPTADLFVTASETPDGLLWIGFDSRPDKVPPRTVSRLSDALRTVLLQIAHGDITTLEAYPRQIADDADLSHDPIPITVGANPARRLVRNASGTPERREALEKLVAELWQQLLGSPPSHMREDFFAAGGDSLMAVRLMSALSRRLDRKLPVALFFEDPTAAGLVSGLAESTSDSGSDHAVTKIVEGSDGRLLFVCSAQRNSVKLAMALGPGPTVYKLDVYNLQEQRLLADQPMLDSVEAIATEFRSRMKAIQPEGPYLLAGGCEGGIVAFEMALQLQQAGEEIALLGQLDTPVRGFFESKPALLRHVRIAKRWLEVCIRRTLTSNAHEYEWHLRIWGGIWPAVRAYHPGRLFDGDVHLFKAARTLGMADIASGWDRRVSGRVVIHKVPGGHHDWMEYPRSAAIVRATLDEIVPPVSTDLRNQLVV
jgi:thioesterase domain-containing protein/acyl carrier protein